MTAALMPAALVAAMCCTVALLVITGYFLLGSLPLLILKHDNPQDARFVRSFLDTYYRFSMFTAGATAISYAFAGWPLFAAGAAALAMSAVALRRVLIPRLASLGEMIPTGAPNSLSRFRRMHVMAIVINLAQLTLIVASLVATSIRMR